MARFSDRGLVAWLQRPETQQVQKNLNSRTSSDLVTMVCSVRTVWWLTKGTQGPHLCRLSGGGRPKCARSVSCFRSGSLLSCFSLSRCVGVSGRVRKCGEE